MSELNIITANLSHGKQFVTASRYMEDYGQVLKIEGIDLPSVYQVDFSNSLLRGTSKTVLGNADGVAIPDEYISTGRDVYAFLYITGDMWGRTIATVRIPNKTRPTRTDAIPTPTQQSVIDQAIAVLNDAVKKTAADVEATAQNVEETDQNATRAEQARDGAEAARDQSVTAKDEAVEAAGDAGRYASAADRSAQAANLDKQDADRYARAAGISAERAEQAANTAGWVDFYIDDDGYLHYVKAESVGLDFYVDADGYLHVVMED